MKKRITAMIMSVLMILSILPISDMTAKDVSAAALSNPRIVSDSSMESGQKVTWDCVWFGSYPQTEIVDQASKSGCYGQPWKTDKDYEVNASLYNSLKSASYDSNGDTTVNGKKYRRLKMDDATYGKTGDSYYFDWSHGETYHYFRYDPIKWRVLKTDGSKALLLADVALDDQKYNEEWIDVTWETCTMRSWLNGTFLNNAFSSTEKSGIVTTSVANHDNIYFGTTGGNNTSDKVFLLSEKEVYNTDTASSYGFVKEYSTYDEGRRSKSSTYAKAMGRPVTYYNSWSGNCGWCLRSPGYGPNVATYVYDDGAVDYLGNDVHTVGGVRPALNLNLSSSSWSNAGTVCSDGTNNEVGGSGTDGGETSHTHSYDAGKITKQPTCTTAGIKTFTCSCGATKTSSIAATGHNYSTNYTVDKQPTIDKEGSKSRHCTRCSAKTAVTSVPRVSTFTIYKGKTATLPTSAKATSWKTSSKRYVKVSSTGVIKGVKKGSATITATIGGKKYTCKVTVNNCTISISSAKITMKKGATYQLKAKATPEANVTYAVTAKKYKKYATVTSSGLITAKKKGTCYIYAKANGVKKKIKVTVK